MPIYPSSLAALIPSGSIYLCCKLSCFWWNKLQFLLLFFPSFTCSIELEDNLIRSLSSFPGLFVHFWKAPSLQAGRRPHIKAKFLRELPENKSQCEAGIFFCTEFLFFLAEIIWSENYEISIFVN